MTARPDFEIKGNFLAHPFADLLAEIGAAGLSGSLRLSDQERKCVIYFKEGRVVFAASNARSSRLFDILLKREKLTKEDLTQIPSFQNDFELTAYLKDKNFLTETECSKLFTEQIESIIVDCLTWENGDWAFNHLARARDGLEFKIDAKALLVEYGRCLPVDKMLSRFRTLDETFAYAGAYETGFQLRPQETFVLTRAAVGTLTAADLVSVASMSESDALHAIYILWLAGLLVRGKWNSAFADTDVKAMTSARLAIKQQAKMPGVPEPVAEEPPEEKPDESVIAGPEPEIELSVPDYLKRVERAETFYDILGVDSKADIPELKRAYFSLARKFHPDRYHAEGGETLARIQHAFTELAQAHETLKNPESRELYDYRVRKELAQRDEARKAGEADDNVSIAQAAQATEQFERGFTLLMDGDPEAATPFLARAAHYAPGNARYRAYYGKALSADDKQRHKAEAEMQAALKIDPNNQTYRLLLAEFFVQYNLTKRAIGELTRLLALHPNNREAQDMLAGLKLK
jgi:curved DNA-binding protein CbpA